MKIGTRPVATAATMLLCAIALTAALAHSNVVTPVTAGLATIPSPTPPAKEATAKVVATCNTINGCTAMKDACKKLKGHSFKAKEEDGSLGVCISPPPRGSFNFRITATGSGKPPADLAAPKRTERGTIYCSGAAMCLKVKTICADLGGTYSGSGDSGACEHD